MSFAFLRRKKDDGRLGLSRAAFTRRKRGGGFTLIELLATLSIIVIITMVTRFGKTQFERSILLTNLGYDIAIAVREAQVSGVNVKAYQPVVGGSISYAVGYGVHFTLSSLFFIFVDQNGNRTYDAGEYRVREYSIKNNNRVSAICEVTFSDPNNCWPASSGYEDITFRRPDPDACFVAYPGLTQPVNTPTSVCIANTNINEVRITVSSDSGSTRVIHVYSSGQISVQNS